MLGDRVQRGHAGNLAQVHTLEFLGLAQRQRLVWGAWDQPGEFVGTDFCASTSDDNSSCKLVDSLKFSRQNNSAESSGFQYSGL